MLVQLKDMINNKVPVNLPEPFKSKLPHCWKYRRKHDTKNRKDR